MGLMLEKSAMQDPRDDIYYLQLARVARLKADASDDPDVARRLREAAIKHERMARRLKAQQNGERR